MTSPRTLIETEPNDFGLTDIEITYFAQKVARQEPLALETVLNMTEAEQGAVLKASILFEE